MTSLCSTVCAAALDAGLMPTALSAQGFTLLIGDDALIRAGHVVAKRWTGCPLTD
jgi:hypothetical protein